MRNHLRLAPAALAFAALLPAQSPTPIAPKPAAPAQKSQAELEKLRDEKLAKPVFKLAPWGFDYDAVREEAKKSGKLIFAYFTRSYAHWGPCDMLESGALSDPTFPEFAKSVVLFLHNTSRIEGVKYDGLLREKGFSGFPTLAILDAEGNVLTSRVPRSVSGFRAIMAALETERTLTKAKEKGPLDATAEGKLLLAGIELGKVDLDTLKSRLGALTGKPDAETVKALDQKLVDLEIGAIFGKHQKAYKPTDKIENLQDAVAADLAPYLEKQRIPSDGVAFRFWNFLRLSAQRKQDEALVKRATAELEALASRDPGQKQLIEATLDPKKRAARLPGAAPESRKSGK